MWAGENPAAVYGRQIPDRRFSFALLFYKKVVRGAYAGGGRIRLLSMADGFQTDVFLLLCFFIKKW